MSVEKVDTLVVGCGQAGLAMSEHLGKNGVSHLVLERSRIAERWRSERWDSLVANGPAWHDRFPGMEFDRHEPGEFVPKEQVADYFVEYAKMIDAPVLCGVDVNSVEKLADQSGYRIETSEGIYEAENVVAATGPFQKPIIPPIVPEDADIVQIHSNTYRNPGQLPEGAVLVVGAGSSGVQIADELRRSGKEVYLSVGPHDRPPRAYRGRDFVWWLGVLGKWDAATPGPGTEHVTISVSGAYGGHTIDFRRLANEGMNLLGLTQSYDNGILKFAPDLAENIRQGDANYLSILDEADAYINAQGLNLPPEPEARKIDPDPKCMTDPTLELNLREKGINSVIWATGYAVDYSWLKVDALDEKGRPVHQRGISPAPGIYFVGLPWLSRRGSSFIWGVWHDAKYIADHIVTRKSYMDHHEKVPATAPATEVA